MATWIEHLAQVRRDIEEEVESIYANASLLAWTNEAAADIARKTRTLVDEQYANTVIGVASYPLPAGTIEPTIMFHNGKKLARESMRDWWNADISASGTPTHYATTSDTLYLRPVPESSGEIRYFRCYEPTPIASVTATTPMPFASRYDPLIRIYVKAKAIEQAGDPNESQMYRQMYDDGLSEALWQSQRERNADADSSPTVVW